MTADWFKLAERGAGLAHKEHTNIAQKWLDKLLSHYSHPTRHYHSLAHIAFMLTTAERYKNQITSWDAIFYATWFHDAIQDIKGNNEKRSAKLARLALTELQLPKNIIDKVATMILATQNHSFSGNSPGGKGADDNYSDIRYFLDFDLAILASKTSVYDHYARQTRQEYKVPDCIYNAGRKRFLDKMLARNSIFLSEEFRHTHEAQAKANLLRERECLGY